MLRSNFTSHRLRWLAVSHRGRPMLCFVCHQGRVPAAERLRGTRTSEHQTTPKTFVCNEGASDHRRRAAQHSATQCRSGSPFEGIGQPGDAAPTKPPEAGQSRYLRSDDLWPPVGGLKQVSRTGALGNRSAGRMHGPSGVQWGAAHPPCSPVTKRGAPDAKAFQE